MKTKTQKNKLKTFFFVEEVKLQSQSFVAETFEEAREQYFEYWEKNIKLGKFQIDSSEMSCYELNKDGSTKQVD